MATNPADFVGDWAPALLEVVRPSGLLPIRVACWMVDLGLRCPRDWPMVTGPAPPQWIRGLRPGGNLHQPSGQGFCDSCDGDFRVRPVVRIFVEYRDRGLAVPGGSFRLRELVRRARIFGG